MEYRIGKPGRIVVVRFGDGENVLGGIAQICRTEGIRAACFNVVGGIKSGRFVVGPETEEMPPEPVWRELQESHEAVAFGTVFWDKEQPKVHFHGVFSKRDSVKAGCLREDSESFLVLEVIITEILDVNIIRELDQESGMVLMKIP